MKISIIIPLHVIEPRFFADLAKFQKLTYLDYEILVVCDKKVDINIPKARLILTKHKRTGPAEKRDIALKFAKGAICAFIDDDAYPDPAWLKNAVSEFALDDKIVAVGGPGITPVEDGYWEQVTGLIYQSYFCGGPTQHRFTPAKKRFVDDYPAYNLLVRTKALKEVGGYGSYFYGGEDTFLCLKLIRQGWKILYDPKVVVYHHRRRLLMPYLRQIANVGKHRGYFAKKFPDTSRLFVYFVPSILLVTFILSLILAVFSNSFRLWFVFGLGLAILVGMLSVIKKTNPLNALFVSLGIIMTHLSYGYGFIQGLLTINLIR